jgi:hypothetical protein
VSRSGSDRQFIVVLVAAIMALVGVAFIISNLSYLDLGDGNDSLAPAINTVTSGVIYLLLAIWLCVIVYLIYFFARARKVGGARASGKPSSPYSMLIALGIIMALIAIFTVSGGKLTPPQLPISTPQVGNDGNSPVNQAGSATTSVLLVVFIALLVLGIVVGTRYFRNRPYRESMAFKRIEQDQADQIIKQAMQELYEGQDVRAVIVRAYQQMCRLIGGTMLGSAPYLTPYEFALLAVKKLDWPEEPVMKLTGLFEEAWYSEHLLDEAKKEEALACMEQLKSSRENARARIGRVEPATEAG